MKEYTVEGFFPQAVAHAAEQLALVRANRFDIAAKRGLDQFRTRPGIKGKQIRTVKLTIQFVRTVPMEWIVKTHKPDTPPGVRGSMHEMPVDGRGPYRREKDAVDAAKEWARTTGRPAWIEKREIP